MIDPDIPINSRNEDKLERWGLAKHIAKILLNQSNNNCIVIGIYGNWGSGKSSLINFVEQNIEEITQKSFEDFRSSSYKRIEKEINKWHENNGYFSLVIPYLNMPLEYENLSFRSALFVSIKYKENSLINLTKNSLQNFPNYQEAPIIFRFNPWNISTIDKLISVYFQELSIAIEKKDKSKNARDLAKKLELYSTFFLPFTYYPDPIISSTSKNIKNMLKDKSNSIKSESKQLNYNIEDIKKEIEIHLESLNRKVIIIIDDIDRLTQTQICQILQLVKINANFKNVIYILLFDREIVEKALDSVSNNKGREYLEKIVQTSFLVPKINDETFEKILKKKLKKVLRQYLENNCDKHRFRNVYNSGYSDLFKSVRDIKRYKNSLKSNISLVYKDVNIIDFLIIEAFRIYIPEIYTLIAKNKEFFTNSILSNEEKELWKERSSSIFTRIGPENCAISKSLLAHLFPGKYEFFGEKYPTGHLNEVEYQKEKRICSKVFFDIYFIFDVPKDILSESKFNKTIKKLKIIETEIEKSKDKNLINPENVRLYYFQKQLEQDNYTIDLILNKLRDKKYATQFLRKLRVRNIEFSKEFLKEFFITLFNVCDNSNRGTETIDVYDIYMVIEKYFQLMEYSDKKTLFGDVIRSSYGINIIRLIINQNISFSEPDSPFKPIFLQEDSNYFKRLWADKVESFAIFGELKNRKEILYLLSDYKIWGNEEKAKKYFDELIATQDGFLDLLMKLSYRRQVITSLDKVSRYIEEIDYQALEIFLPTEEIEKRINNLDNLNYNDSTFVEFAKERLVKYKRKAFAE